MEEDKLLKLLPEYRIVKTNKVTNSELANFVANVTEISLTQEDIKLLITFFNYFYDSESFNIREKHFIDNNLDAFADKLFNKTAILPVNLVKSIDPIRFKLEN